MIISDILLMLKSKCISNTKTFEDTKKLHIQKTLYTYK